MRYLIAFVVACHGCTYIPFGLVVTRTLNGWQPSSLLASTIAGDVAFSGGAGPRGQTLGLSGAQVLELWRVDSDVHLLLLDDERPGALIG